MIWLCLKNLVPTEFDGVFICFYGSPESLRAKNGRYYQIFRRTPVISHFVGCMCLYQVVSHGISQYIPMIVLKSIPIYPHNIPMFDGSPQELSHLESHLEASRASGADDFIKN